MTVDEDREALYGVIRIGDLSIALPTQAIRELVPRPAQFLAFPSLIPQIVGAIALRGQVIPVIDLERMLNSSVATQRSTPGSIIVVIRHGNFVHGIIADSADGVSSLSELGIGKLEIAGGADEPRLISSTFTHGDKAGIILNPAALAQISGLPMAGDRVAHADEGQRSVEPTLIFEIAGMRCALSVAYVDASLPAQQLYPAPMTGPLWMGMVPHKGVQIPVIDTLALFNQGDLRGRSCGGAVVLRSRLQSAGGQHDFGMVAMLIDSVDDIVRLGQDRIAPIDGELRSAPFVKGIIDLEGGPCLLIDGDRLVSDPLLMQLGEIRQDAAPTALAQKGAASAPQQATSVKSDASEPHLVFVVGASHFAAPLLTIDEILIGDGGLIPLPARKNHVVGLLSRRGRSVPILDLGQRLGCSGPNEGKFLLIARVDGPGQPGRVGFTVDALKSVERAAPQRLARPAEQGAGIQSPLGLLEHTIRLEDGSACSVLDLPRMAADLLGSADHG